ncbi:MAG: hypothetical protein JW959_13545 [Pirellulales bacterium]|nr:hypothetical protein [Pirellulales bacterium]
MLDQPPEIFSTTTANQPRSVTAMKPVLDEWEERRQPVCLKDDFGLPLVIVLEAPEVPAEISGPSPPIEEAPEEAPKTKNGWWW